MFKHAVYDEVQDVVGVLSNSDPGEMKGIHGVAAPGGYVLGSLGAGVSEPPKTWLPKAEPFPGGGSSSTSLPYPPQSHGQELVQGQRTLLEVSLLGALLGRWKAGDWLQRGWMPACWG